MNRFSNRYSQPFYCVFQCNDMTNSPLESNLQINSSIQKKKKIKLSKGTLSNEVSVDQNTTSTDSKATSQRKQSNINLMNPKQIYVRYSKQNSSILQNFKKKERIINLKEAPKGSVENRILMNKIQNNIHSMKNPISNNTLSRQSSNLKSQLQNLVHKSTITVEDNCQSHQRKKIVIQQSKILRDFFNMDKQESKVIKSREHQQQKILHRTNYYYS